MLKCYIIYFYVGNIFVDFLQNYLHDSSINQKSKPNIEFFSQRFHSLSTWLQSQKKRKQMWCCFSQDKPKGHVKKEIQKINIRIKIMDFQRKKIDLYMINGFLHTSSVVELEAFLNTYVIEKLGLDLSHKQTQQLLQCLNNNANLINQKMISRSNAVEMVLQALYHSNNGDADAKSSQMISSIQNSLKYLIGNQPYLRDKWRRQELDYEAENKSIQLAKKLIQQEKRKFAMQRQEKQKFSLQCQICLVEISMRDLGTLVCGHMFHRKCLTMHMKSSINEHKLQIKCPQEQCGIRIPLKDIKQYVERPLLQKLDQFRFNQYVQTNSKNTSWCPTPGCTAVFQFDQLLVNYRCPGCKKHYCLKCKTKYHEGMTCAAYRINNRFGQEDRKFVEFVRGAKYKQCPKCNFWVERSDGCSTMRCRCGTRFCYDCGGSDCPHGACKYN